MGVQYRGSGDRLHRPRSIGGHCALPGRAAVGGLHQQAFGSRRHPIEPLQQESSGGVARHLQIFYPILVFGRRLQNAGYRNG